MIESKTDLRVGFFGDFTATLWRPVSLVLSLSRSFGHKKLERSPSNIIKTSLTSAGWTFPRSPGTAVGVLVLCLHPLLPPLAGLNQSPIPLHSANLWDQKNKTTVKLVSEEVVKALAQALQRHIHWGKRINMDLPKLNSRPKEKLGLGFGFEFTESLSGEASCVGMLFCLDFLLSMGDLLLSLNLHRGCSLLKQRLFDPRLPQQ